MSTDEAHLGPPERKPTYDPDECGRALAFLLSLDIADRCGIGDEWANIDVAIQDEILTKWSAMIAENIREFNTHTRLSTARACAEECETLLSEFITREAHYGAAKCASAIRARFGVER